MKNPLIIARFASGLTQNEIAALSGLSNVTVNKLEQNPANVSPESVASYIDALPENAYKDNAVQWARRYVAETGAGRAVARLLNAEGRRNEVE